MVYKKKVEVTDPRFVGRDIIITTGRREFGEVIPIPDNVVLCDGCNKNLCDEEIYQDRQGYLIYLGKRELKADQPYDIYCEGCTKELFPKAIEVGYNGNVIP